MKYSLRELAARLLYFVKVKLRLADPEKDFWCSFHTCAEGFGPPDPPEKQFCLHAPAFSERDFELMYPNPNLITEKVALHPYPRTSARDSFQRKAK